MPGHCYSRSLKLNISCPVFLRNSASQNAHMPHHYDILIRIYKLYTKNWLLNCVARLSCNTAVKSKMMTRQFF